MRKKKSEYVQDLVTEVMNDFLKRQKERKVFESQWRLNNDFLQGKQNLRVNSLDDIENECNGYSWQMNEVFNHIAPIVESRLARLVYVRPEMDVMPTSDNESDIKTASLSRDILRSVYEKLNIAQIINKGTNWSEIAGTSFYKVTWNNCGGKKIFDKDGKSIFEGEVQVDVVSPYEIYPDSADHEDIENCESIIHAKKFSRKAIKNIWGVDILKESDDDMFVVVERYESPSVEYPEGRVVVVCEDKLLYVGELPYINLADKKRGFPFVKQVCLRVTGSFWGKSVVEKIIPVQRAYNAVRNRKHEYLNRISMGVLTVEEGSVDITALEDDGLEPGRIVVYRQNATPPKFMEEEKFPECFENEEGRLLSEFSQISGVSDMLNSDYSLKNMSGTALEILVEQNTQRLSASIDEIKIATKNVAKMILRLYKQFAVVPRLKVLENGKDSVVCWKNSDLGLEDIKFMSDSLLDESVASKRDYLLKLLSSGILKDKNGNIDENFKQKILSLV